MQPYGFNYSCDYLTTSVRRNSHDKPARSYKYITFTVHVLRPHIQVQILRKFYSRKSSLQNKRNYFPLKGNSLKERYPQVLWSILLVGKLLQIFGFYTSGIGNPLKYIDLMHQIHRLITVAHLHVCQPVLLDVRGIVRVFEVFVQLLGLKLAL